MNCKKCGKSMPNGARYCISCGAEHDSNGELVIKNNSIDYNKTMMSNDIKNSRQNNSIDYNKTMMALDNHQNSGSVDYNTTMMASEVLQSNNSKSSSINNFKKPDVKKSKVTKKKLPLVLIIILIMICIICLVRTMKRFVKSLPVCTIPPKGFVDGKEALIETTINENIVSDFDSSSGYWSKDAEYFYKNGTKQTNQWIGDYYVGADGRKVKNQLIDDTYYVDASGKRVKNEWYKFNKNIGDSEVPIWYYLGADGAKLRNTFTPDGYYVDKDGIYIPDMIYDGEDSEQYVADSNIAKE